MDLSSSSEIAKFIKLKNDYSSIFIQNTNSIIKLVSFLIKYEFTKLDSFSIWPGFLIKGHFDYKTNLGGIITMLILIISIIIIFIFFYFIYFF